MGANRLAKQNIDWIEQYCCVPEGKDVGSPAKLRPWQKRILRGIYGSPTRRAVISFGRKNGKTSLSAFILLLHLCGPMARQNSQLYSAAQSRDQAGILFSLAAKIVRLSPDLNQYVGIRDTAKQLYCGELGTLYRALSAEASTAYGLSPSLVVHDELGQVRGPRSELYEALETAAGAQEDPLSIVISTQAPTDGDLMSILIDDADTGKDSRTKLFLYTAPEGKDPFSAEAQKAANPALGDFLNKREVKEQAESARRMPAREAAYRNLVLNQRIDMANPLIPRTVWERCGGGIDEDAFREGMVYAGLDLSARNDLTALALVAKRDGVWHGKVEFFAPQVGINDRATRDRAPYDLWARQGYLTATSGASVNYEDVVRRLVEVCDEYHVVKIGFDRWRMDIIHRELERVQIELPMEPFGQGYKDMTPAIDEFESLLLNQEFRHDDNPLLTWNAANTVAVSDPAGNRKLDKSKSTGRIDGIVALVMAIGQSQKASEQAFDIDAMLASEPVRVY